MSGRRSESTLVHYFYSTRLLTGLSLLVANFIILCVCVCTMAGRGGIEFLDHLMICTYKVQKMEATFRGNHKNIVAPIEMVTTYTEQTRSRKMETTIRGNHKTKVYPNCNGSYIY